jgi:hypothetical protein
MIHAGYFCFGTLVLENLQQSCSFFSQRMRVDRKTLIPRLKDRTRQLAFKGIEFTWTTGVNLVTVAMNLKGTAASEDASLSTCTTVFLHLL